MRNDNLNYRATLCVACRSGRSASDLVFAARRRFVTQSVTHSIPTRSVRNDDLNYRASLRVACRSGRSASGLAFAAWRRFLTQSVTHGIPTLERAER
ncbi:hypothetical protein ALQ09_100773 [Pseudomonas viridiflava]|nr:hypothetical protein ALQ09_100773 [Pseudomonas viridiflava]